MVPKFSDRELASSVFPRVPLDFPNFPPPPKVQPQVALFLPPETSLLFGNFAFYFCCREAIEMVFSFPSVHLLLQRKWVDGCGWPSFSTRVYFGRKAKNPPSPFFVCSFSFGGCCHCHKRPFFGWTTAKKLRKIVA